jgi:hypothetical protein
MQPFSSQKHFGWRFSSERGLQRQSTAVPKGWQGLELAKTALAFALAAD